jgi:phosphoglycolate phosphatase-like HAD superfamily hydrolase
MFFVFDLDGTLADVDHRRHLVNGPKPDWPSFYRACVNDTPKAAVISALQAHLASGHGVEIWSGRSDEVRLETHDWLESHGIAPALLTRMRAARDYTPDHILKRSWLMASDRRPDAVYGDRNKVVAMWRQEGIPCFQVAPGDF